MESNQKSVSPKLLSCSDSGAQAKTHDFKNALYGESIELKLKINNLSETVRALKLRAQARLASTRSPPFKPTAMSMIHLEQIQEQIQTLKQDNRQLKQSKVYSRINQLQHSLQCVKQECARLDDRLAQQNLLSRKQLQAETLLQQLKLRVQQQQSEFRQTLKRKTDLLLIKSQFQMRYTFAQGKIAQIGNNQYLRELKEQANALNSRLKLEGECVTQLIAEKGNLYRQVQRNKQLSHIQSSSRNRLNRSLLANRNKLQNEISLPNEEQSAERKVDRQADRTGKVHNAGRQKELDRLRLLISYRVFAAGLSRQAFASSFGFRDILRQSDIVKLFSSPPVSLGEDESVKVSEYCLQHQKKLTIKKQKLFSKLVQWLEDLEPQTEVERRQIMGELFSKREELLSVFQLLARGKPTVALTDLVRFKSQLKLADGQLKSMLGLLAQHSSSMMRLNYRQALQDLVPIQL